MSNGYWNWWKKNKYKKNLLVRINKLKDAHMTCEIKSYIKMYFCRRVSKMVGLEKRKKMYYFKCDPWFLCVFTWPQWLQFKLWQWTATVLDIYAFISWPIFSIYFNIVQWWEFNQHTFSTPTATPQTPNNSKKTHRWRGRSILYWNDINKTKQSRMGFTIITGKQIGPHDLGRIVTLLFPIMTLDKMDFPVCCSGQDSSHYIYIYNTILLCCS